MIKNLNILITGGAGYKGSSLVPTLLPNHKVDVLDHHISPECTLIPFTRNKNFNFIKKDIRDIKKKDISKYDLIIHLAGLSGYPACEANPGIAEAVNVGSTKNLCNLMSKDQKLIYASTTYIYEISKKKINEESPVSPKTLYEENKEAKKVEKEKKEKEREQSKNSASSAKSTNETSGSGGSGTAFFIDNKGHVITNNHVVKGFENRAKIFYDNEDVKLKFIACDEQLDLALLKANVQNEEYIEIADKVVRKMQNIVAAGYPLGKHLSDDLKFTSGIVSSLKGPGNNSAIMQIDAALNPGNSGGPIVDKENGHLAAVAVSGLRKDMTEGINYGIKASRVKEFLESNRIIIKSKKNSSEKLDVSERLENATVYISCE